MEAIVWFAVVVFLVWVVFKLGLFNPIVTLSRVADSAATNFERSHTKSVLKSASKFDMDEKQVTEAYDKLKRLDEITKDLQSLKL